MKDAYISYVLEEFISDGNFEAVFGDQWIDEAQMTALASTVCNRAFAEYGINAGGKYAGQAEALLTGMRESKVIVRNGDEYSDYWYKLRSPQKKKFVEELQAKNPVTSRIGALGGEALRRALNKIAAEDELRTLNEEEIEGGNSGTDEGDTKNFESLPKRPNPKFFEVEDRRDSFVALANEKIAEVERSDLSNADKSQAQGFLTAAKALSETPKPPIDLIWTILNRANSLAGIGSFFLALIMLIAMVI